MVFRAQGESPASCACELGLNPAAPMLQHMLNQKNSCNHGSRPRLPRRGRHRLPNTTYGTGGLQIRRMLPKIDGFHDAARLATLHNSAMPGPLTRRYLILSYLTRRHSVISLSTAPARRRVGIQFDGARSNAVDLVACGARVLVRGVACAGGFSSRHRSAEPAHASAHAPKVRPPHVGGQRR